MKLDIGKIADADDVAEALGVSRKTVIRRARENDADVMLAGKVYVERKKLRDVAGDRWNDEAETLSGAVRGKGAVDTRSVISRRKLAAMIGVDATTVWRVTCRHDIGIEAYRGNRIFTRDMADKVLAGVGKSALTREEISEMRRRAANARWSRQRGAKSGKTGRGAASSPVRRSRAVSR